MVIQKKYWLVSQPSPPKKSQTHINMLENGSFICSSQKEEFSITVTNAIFGGGVSVASTELSLNGGDSSSWWAWLIY